MFTELQSRDMPDDRGIIISFLERGRHGHTIDPEALHIIPKLACPQSEWDANKPIEQNTYQHIS